MGYWRWLEVSNFELTDFLEIWYIIVSHHPTTEFQVVFEMKKFKTPNPTVAFVFSLKYKTVSYLAILMSYSAQQYLKLLNRIEV